MLKTFLPLFAMTFFIVLFIVLMQFLWKYIDDLVGKGLGLGVLGELFFYAAVSMVPMALPLAILLASLMTFGNLGEKFELTAMKASGISLVRVMAPLIVTVGVIAVGAFFFQNDVLPKAQVKMWTLLFSMRQKSPELEIPEDVFYDQIPGYNLYVKEKDKTTGMLRNVMIYDVSSGGDNATVITSDSAQMAMTPDMRYLYLHLYKGEQFENLRDQNSRKSGMNTPFRRETFLDKQVLIPFDANFNRLDEEGMRKQYVGKNINQLMLAMDSISARLDSIGRDNFAPLVESELRGVNTARAVLSNPDNAKRKPASKAAAEPGSSEKETSEYAAASDLSGDGINTSMSVFDGGESFQLGDRGRKYEFDTIIDKKLAAVAPIRIDTLLRSLPEKDQASVINNALTQLDSRRQILTFRAQVMDDEKKILRRNDIELIKKFTLSVACVIFFFIGAPLGAIIRKGGLGTPLVISVLLFVVYYIIDNTGYKMARDGKIEVWIGMWLSTFILAPLGVYVTWKAMNDSAVFDKDRYVSFMRKLVGARGVRSVASKEVIINEIDIDESAGMLEALAGDASALGKRYGRLLGYKRYWLRGIDPAEVAEVAERLENTITYLTDSRDPQVVGLLGDFPVMRQVWVYRPARRQWLGWTMMVLFPLGLPVYLAGLQAQKDLRTDCRLISERCRLIISRLKPGYEPTDHDPATAGIEDEPLSATPEIEEGKE
ncbi:MAG: LptF/LptG family permease [Muribaculaceae bacterium]|nr:LptF/LptG family permease [Muribaculaceae bacterium]